MKNINYKERIRSKDVSKLILYWLSLLIVLTLLGLQMAYVVISLTPDIKIPKWSDETLQEHIDDQKDTDTNLFMGESFINDYAPWINNINKEEAINHGYEYIEVNEDAFVNKDIDNSFIFINGNYNIQSSDVTISNSIVMGKLNIEDGNITIDNTLVTDINFISEYGSLTIINSAAYLEPNVSKDFTLRIHTSIDNNGSIVGAYNLWQEGYRGKEYKGYFLDIKKR